MGSDLRNVTRQVLKTIAEANSVQDIKMTDYHYRLIVPKAI